MWHFFDNNNEKSFKFSRYVRISIIRCDSDCSSERECHSCDGIAAVLMWSDEWDETCVVLMQMGINFKVMIMKLTRVFWGVVGVELIMGIEDLIYVGIWTMTQRRNVIYRLRKLFEVRKRNFEVRKRNFEVSKENLEVKLSNFEVYQLLSKILPWNSVNCWNI